MNQIPFFFPSLLSHLLFFDFVIFFPMSSFTLFLFIFNPYFLPSTPSFHCRAATLVSMTTSIYCQNRSVEERCWASSRSSEGFSIKLSYKHSTTFLPHSAIKASLSCKYYIYSSVNNLFLYAFAILGFSEILAATDLIEMQYAALLLIVYSIYSSLLENILNGNGT